MTTEYGQRFLIECETEGDEEETSKSSGDREDEEMEDDSDVLLGEIERTFGFQHHRYGATNNTNNKVSLMSASQHIHTIRFQVVVWNIGKLDVATGSVPMTFRVSLFWNDLPTGAASSSNNNNHHHKKARRDSSNSKPIAYTLQGRTKAVPINRTESQISSLSADDDDNDSDKGHDNNNKSNNTDGAIDIPPLSILNVSTFTIIGTPEVDMLDASPHSRLIRWTCMYRATVMQDHLNVKEFPHDCHNISLELAILTHRRAGQRWDRRFWKLGLATEDDVQVSRKALRVPYGLVVDHVKIPEFHFHRFCHSPKQLLQDGSSSSFYQPPNYGGGPTGNNTAGGGLQFQFCSQQDGSFDRRSSACAISDVYLRVSLMVLRESGYYDRNIVPLLAFLNVIAATLTFILDPEKFFYRALLILNIAFNQIGVRLSVDKHLPSVGYEIRMQQILNEFFFVLLALILQAALVYGLETNRIVASTYCLNVADGIAALVALGHNGYTVFSYYAARTRARHKYQQGILEDQYNDYNSISKGGLLIDSIKGLSSYRGPHIV